MTYRKDIDSLRAIAIVLVFSFHFGIPRFEGGFVGVDVFFVISGYLMALLAKENFISFKESCGAFYLRRVRRIVPLSFTVLFTSLLFAVFYLDPPALLNFQYSFISSIFFISNFFFWSQNTYFDENTIRPLLHFWSLGIEAQFYLIFPMLFFLPLRRFMWVGLFIGSILFSVWMTDISAKTAFFFLPARLCEFLIGLGTYYIGQLYALKRFPFRVLLISELLGIFLILFATFSFSNETMFPSAYILAPAIGAALLLWAGEYAGPISQTFQSITFIRFIVSALYTPPSLEDFFA